MKQRLQQTSYAGESRRCNLVAMDLIDTLRERIADGIIHAVSVAAGLVAVTVMMVVAVPALPTLTTASLAVYGAAMVSMFGCSAAYHLIPVTRWKSTLRRWDQAAIFVKIAGTYTPFACLAMSGIFAYIVLGAVWTIALVGAAGKLLLASRWDRTAIVLYLTLGWVSLIMLAPLWAQLPTLTLALLVVGGSLYSIGVIFHLWRGLPYQNAIWHLFVLGGTGCHFGAVTSAVFV